MILERVFETYMVILQVDYVVGVGRMGRECRTGGKGSLTKAGWGQNSEDLIFHVPFCRQILKCIF